MSEVMHGAVAHYQGEIARRESSLPPSIAGGPVRWSDRPHGFSVRPGLLELPLQRREVPLTTDFDALSAILRGSSGLIGGRLQINWNCSHEEVMDLMPRYRRPAASGGGLYPIDIYVVARGIADLPDGLFHYCEAHGSLVLLRAGDYHAHVAQSCADEQDRPGFYLILAAQFWRNMFKYQNFGYHVVNFDCGAMLAAIDQTARPIDARVSIRHMFDDTALAALVGLDPEQEAVLAVAAVCLRGLAVAKTPGRVAHQPGITQPIPRPVQRSRRVEVPPLAYLVHRETCKSAPVSNPQPVARRPIVANSIQPPGPPEQHRTRGSVYGQFDPSRTMERAVLDRMVQRARAPYDSDVPFGSVQSDLARLMVIVVRVSGLRPGIYETDDAGEIGSYRAPLPEPAVLQSLYYLPNQNVAGCGAIFVIVGRTELARARLGARSIRVLNAQAGTLGQRLYGAAAEAGCGGSAALGFNAVALDRLCGLEAGAESALLLYFAGTLLPDAGFDSRF